MVKVPKPTNGYKKIKRLKKAADKLWYHVVLALGGHVCLVCGGKATQSHHFIPKSLSGCLRLEVKNGIPLCFGCHDRLHRTADPKIIDTIISRNGQGWYAEIRDARFVGGQVRFHFTIGYLEDKIVELEKELEKVAE